jgi:dihydroorotate dehydrogenase (fumarate)
VQLETSYLGLRLAHPFMVGASPLVDDLDLVRRLEDAGSAAIVMHSLYEEQLTSEQLATSHHMEIAEESFGEAQSFLPRPPRFALGPDEYLEQIRRIKEMVAVPVIGSLNGVTVEGMLQYARLIEQAGADALELNLYYLPTEETQDGTLVERRTVETVRHLVAKIRLPVAVKLSPFYSSFLNLARQLDETGARGLVLFNRFYQPDIDPENLQTIPALRLSDSSELPLRIRWLGIVYGRVRASLAVTGGVHTGLDAVKAVMAGANGVQLVSALLRHGPERLGVVRDEFTRWLEEHEYDSVEQLCGSMSLLRCPDPAAYERTGYMTVLQSWQGFR